MFNAMVASAVFPLPTIFKPTTNAKSQNKSDHSCNALFFALHLFDDHRQAAENQTNKRHIGRQRICAEQKRDQLGQTENAQYHAQRIRPTGF